MDWTPIWHQAAAPAFAMGFLAGKKKTVVYSVISQVSGEKLRVRFSNHYGKKPYTIGGLTVWAQGEMHTVTRDGSCVFTVPATRVTMTGGNVAHSGPEFGDEDDMLFLNLEFGNNTYAIVEYGSAFHWPEHYVLIQGTKGAIRIDMCNVGMTVKLADGTEEHYCVHANKEIDDDRTRIYHSTEMDGAIQYGHPGKKPPMWLNSIMNAEREFFNGVMHGDPIPDEF